MNSENIGNKIYKPEFDTILLDTDLSEVRMETRNQRLLGPSVQLLLRMELNYQKQG